MQCDFCAYEFSLGEIQAQAPCPRCAASAENTPKPRAANPAVAPHVQKALEEFRGAQAVVVMDINMSFNSMVWFMVKWVIASIPAMIILSLLVFALIMVFGGVIGGLDSLA